MFQPQDTTWTLKRHCMATTLLNMAAQINVTKTDLDIWKWRHNLPRSRCNAPKNKPSLPPMHKTSMWDENLKSIYKDNNNKYWIKFHKADCSASLSSDEYGLLLMTLLKVRLRISSSEVRDQWVINEVQTREHRSQNWVYKQEQIFTVFFFCSQLALAEVRTWFLKWNCLSETCLMLILTIRQSINILSTSVLPNFSPQEAAGLNVWDVFNLQHTWFEWINRLISLSSSSAEFCLMTH